MKSLWAITLMLSASATLAAEPSYDCGQLNIADITLQATAQKPERDFWGHNIVESTSVRLSLQGNTLKIHQSCIYGASTNEEIDAVDFDAIKQEITVHDVHIGPATEHFIKCGGYSAECIKEIDAQITRVSKLVSMLETSIRQGAPNKNRDLTIATCAQKHLTNFKRAVLGGLEAVPGSYVVPLGHK